MRIQKFLSQQQILSRRETEILIRQGLIKVNGKLAEIGMQIDPEKDRIEILDIGNKTPEKITVAFNKPRGIESSQTEYKGQTLNSVGRLDKESEGLLLLSNDGTVTAAATGDQHLIEKEYEVTTQENIHPNQIKKMSSGIYLEDGMTLPAKVTLINKNNFLIILKEGRKHQIRRMAAALKLTVTKLKRIRIGNIKLGDLKIGEYKVISLEEITILKSLS